MDVVMFPDALAEAIGYLSGSGVKATIEHRPSAATGLHVKLTDPGGATVSGYTLEEHVVVVDVSHPDSVEASLQARRLAAIFRQWPIHSQRVYADPRRVCTAPVWNPLDEPRVPAYTLTVHFSLGGETVEV